MYQASQQAQGGTDGQTGAQGGAAGSPGQGAGSTEDVTDVDYEEVK